MHITVCRDVAKNAYADCIKNQNEPEVSMAAPCKVDRGECEQPKVSDFVGPEADSSAARQYETLGEPCCEC